jgi:hypothetical protein
MPVKKTVIKVEDGEGEVQADKGQDSKEAAGAGREQRRLLRPCDTFRKSLGGSCKGTGAVFSKDGFKRMKVMALEQPCAKLQRQELKVEAYKATLRRRDVESNVTTRCTMHNGMT